MDNKHNNNDNNNNNNLETCLSEFGTCNSNQTVGSECSLPSSWKSTCSGRAQHISAIRNTSTIPRAELEGVSLDKLEELQIK